MEEYDVVIVHYRDPAAILRVLSMLARQNAKPARVVVADNSHRDVPFLSETWTHGVVEVVDCGDNPGYGAAVNCAVSVLNPQRSQFVLVLTQDAQLEASAVSSMIDTALATSAGCVAPVLYWSSKPGKVYSAGANVGKYGGVAHSKTAVVGGLRRAVDSVDGAVMLVRRSAFDYVGGFWDGYFLYYEETELCLRLRDFGGVWVDGGAKGWQEPGNFTPYLRVRNQFFLLRRLNMLRASGVVALIWQCLRTATGALLRGHPLGVAWAVRGFFDGLLNRSGKPPRSPFVVSA